MDYDLLTMTGIPLYRFFDTPRDVEALAHFVCNLTMDSKTLQAESGYEHIDEWGLRFRTNQLLADLYDLTNSFRYVFLKSKRQKPNKPKPYPRPWDKTKKKIGKKPVKVSKFWRWWNGQ